MTRVFIIGVASRRARAAARMRRPQAAMSLNAPRSARAARPTSRSMSRCSAPAARDEPKGDACATLGAILCAIGCVAIVGFGALLAYQLVENYPHTVSTDTDAPSTHAGALELSHVCACVCIRCWRRAARRAAARCPVPPSSRPARPRGAGARKPRPEMRYGAAAARTRGAVFMPASSSRGRAR